MCTPKFEYDIILLFFLRFNFIQPVNVYLKIT